MGLGTINQFIKFLPIKCSTERLQHLASFASLRESFFIRSFPHGAKPVLSKVEGTPRPQRKIFSYFSELGVLCGSPRGISFPQKRYLFIHGIISRGEPRGISTRPRSSCSPEALFHRASHRLSDSLNPNSTENFKYVWLVFSSILKA